MTDDIRPEDTFGEPMDEIDVPEPEVDESDPGVTSVIESLRDEFGVSDGDDTVVDGDDIVGHADDIVGHADDIVVEQPEPAAEDLEAAEDAAPWAADDELENPADPVAPFAAEEPVVPWAPRTFAELLDPPVDANLPAMPSILDQAAPREMDLGPEKRVRWWPWALAGFIVVLVLGAVGYGWWWVTARPIVVPDVIGKRPAEATQTLNDLELRLGTVSEIPTDSAPVGTIIDQKPVAGTELKPDERVELVLAASPEQTKIPNVVGVSTEDAARTLAEARLTYAPIESHSETVAAGFVISQLPTVGAEVPPGAAIALVVSKGLPPVARSVPSVAGLSEADAIAVTEAAGFVARAARSVDPSITAGMVLEQVPAARASAPFGSDVHILVSQGPATGVAVPSMTGNTRKQAVAKLEARNLKPNVLTAHSPTVAKGRIILQMPGTNRRAVAAGTVDIVVSAGPLADVPVPSVIGTVSAGATATIEASGFMPTIVTIEVADAPVGSVISQFPPAGTNWKLGYPVVCLVAQAPKP